VRELVRVHDRPDALDFPASNFECPDGNQPALFIERQRPGAGVHLDEAHGHANALEALQPVQQRSCDTAAAAQRPRERRDLAATVACQHDVAGEQCLKARQIAGVGGGEELGIWAVTAGTSMAGATTFVGDHGRFLPIGGCEIGDSALVRWSLPC
jgi:hypothetical protein